MILELNVTGINKLVLEILSNKSEKKLNLKLLQQDSISTKLTMVRV